jgi:hypothetical protein
VALIAERGGYPFGTAIPPLALLEGLLFALAGQDRQALATANDRRDDLGRRLARSRDEVPRPD